MAEDEARAEQAERQMEINAKRGRIEQQEELKKGVRSTLSWQPKNLAATPSRSNVSGDFGLDDDFGNVDERAELASSNRVIPGSSI